MRVLICTTLLLAVAVAGPVSAQTQGEWGDAPEGVMAYPSLGVMGSFPTCFTVGPASFIYHGPLCWAHFPGPAPPFDFEMDGNAGLCPGFAPYDADECWPAPDAGLLFPPAYTIVGGLVIPCSNPGGLGQGCTMATWGGNVDILVVNNMPCDGFVNVDVDWDRSGNWAGASNCPTAQAPEHVLVNFPIPMGYGGPLSALGPPPFLIGPNAGPNSIFVWSRFSITEQPVPQNWDGSGVFEDGETEDYLLEVYPQPSPVQDQSWGSIKSMYK